ncbi:MAG TPA: glycosyl hydrolase [Phycisphaerae bacterium]|nr:glycosyl hydrolase [Phycisphaerae bacterium]HRR85908.1 glycosyl hydrolase [Phycisphaerae bacterium]
MILCLLDQLVLTMCVTAGISAEPWQAHDWREELRLPSPEFSLMPFWFWNDDLDDDEIRRQMAAFREKGVHGFVIHARMGLPKDLEYMGPRWLGHVRFAVEEAARTGMRVCLYDEGMYPSGSAHGQVVQRNPSFAAQGLAVEAQRVDGPTTIEPAVATKGRLVARVLIRPGEGESYRLETARAVPADAQTIEIPSGQWVVMTFLQVPTEGWIRGVHDGEDDREPNAPPAADLLNPDAMRAFLQLAYEPYYETVGKHFGKTIIAMFTDEPSLTGRGGRKDIKPWTGGFSEYFRAKAGYDLTTRLPALFFDVGEQTGKIRADYHSIIDQRLEETYYRPLSQWCQRHGIALTGHPAASDEINCLRHFQIPGQDLVWRYVVPGDNSAIEGPHSTAAKGTSSVARHDGRRRNSNEILGAYGWNLMMEEMKFVADHVLLRGQNLLYPHAFYYSVRGSRLHERPPDVGPHNAWWPHYQLFADYTARLCGLLTDSEQVCDVAVAVCDNRLPWRAARWLYQNQVDFNYVEESRFTEQAVVRDGHLEVGRMRYRTLIIDSDEDIPQAVSAAAASLERTGGLVRRISTEPAEPLVSLKDRDVIVSPPAADLRYVHLVKREIDFYLLGNEGEAHLDTHLTVRSVGEAEWFDAWKGVFSPATVVVATDSTITVPLHLPRRETRVLCIDTSKPPTVASVREPGGFADLISLEGSWEIAVGGKEMRQEELGDWTAWSGMEDEVGPVHYQRSFQVHRDQGKRYQLDLGQVGDWVVVRLNGQELGVRFWSPFTWGITDALRDGENTLVVEVTGSLANRHDPKKRRPAGLMGPVRVLATSRY